MNEFHQLSFSTFRGVLLGGPYQDLFHEMDDVWGLSDGEQVLQCLIPSGDLLRRLLEQPITTHWLQLVTFTPDDPGTQGPLPLLTDAWPDSAKDQGAYQLPDRLCPLDGVVGGTLDLVSEITAAPLREFVERVFQDREVSHRYWIMPASAKHHHAYPGGLAEHSLEVARDLAGQSSLESQERDLCIAGGLLHDIGKLWSYTDDMFQNEAARAMGHELIGLTRMTRGLDALQLSWPDGAYAMRVLLSGCGRMRQDGSMPSALVARVKAADQRSCERERSTRQPSRVWTPKRWEPNQAPG